MKALLITLFLLGVAAVAWFYLGDAQTPPKTKAPVVAVQPAAKQPAMASSAVEGDTPNAAAPPSRPDVTANVNLETYMPTEVQTYVNMPIVNNLPPVQGIADFSEQVSMKPMLTSDIKVLKYRTETSNVVAYVVKGSIVKTNQSSPVTTGYKRMEFAKGEKPDEISYTEVFGVNGVPNAKENRVSRNMNVDGRYVRDPKNHIKEFYQELDPKFPPHQVHMGEAWSQRIAVNPELNPGGQVIANLKVEATYLKDQKRMARIRRQYSFYTYRPALTNASASQEKEKEGKEVMYYKVDELYDFVIADGYYDRKSTTHRQYFKTHGFAATRAEGMVLESRTVETLVGIE